MYNKSQGRNNHGRTIVLPNPPKHQPQFHQVKIDTSGKAIAITNRGIEMSIRPGIWAVVVRPFHYFDIPAIRNFFLNMGD